MESLYRRHHFPPEIISDAVWLYHRFTLSFAMARTCSLSGASQDERYAVRFGGLVPLAVAELLVPVLDNANRDFLLGFLVDRREQDKTPLVSHRGRTFLVS